MKGEEDENCESEGRVRREKLGINGWWKIGKCEREGSNLLSKLIFTVQITLQSTD